MEIRKQVVRTKLLAVIVFGAAISGTVRADATYDSKIQITGGSVFPAVLALEPPDLGARRPAVLTYVIKGGRMAALTKGHATIVNLDKETIFEVDLIRKTYFSRTFAEMKQVLEQATPGTSAEPKFQVSGKSTDRTKVIESLNADERVVTGDVEGSSPDSVNGPQSVAHIFVDSWILTVPGFSQVEDFRRRLGEKLSYAYALGLSDIAAVQPELRPGFEALAKALVRSDGMPVESTIRMGAQGVADLSSLGDPASQKSGVVSGALSRLGSIRRKEPIVRPSAPGVLIEMTTELSNFSSGFADEAKFNVPDGFKQVQPPAPKPAH